MADGPWDCTLEAQHSTHGRHSTLPPCLPTIPWVQAQPCRPPQHVHRPSCRGDWQGCAGSEQRHPHKQPAAGLCWSWRAKHRPPPLRAGPSLCPPTTMPTSRPAQQQGGPVTREACGAVPCGEALPCACWPCACWYTSVCLAVCLLVHLTAPDACLTAHSRLLCGNLHPPAPGCRLSSASGAGLVVYERVYKAKVRVCPERKTGAHCSQHKVHKCSQSCFHSAGPAGSG